MAGDVYEHGMAIEKLYGQQCITIAYMVSYLCFEVLILRHGCSWPKITIIPNNDTTILRFVKILLFLSSLGSVVTDEL